MSHLPKKNNSLHVKSCVISTLFPDIIWCSKKLHLSFIALTLSFLVCLAHEKNLCSSLLRCWLMLHLENYAYKNKFFLPNKSAFAWNQKGRWIHVATLFGTWYRINSISPSLKPCKMHFCASYKTKQFYLHRYSCALAPYCIIISLQI